jgi:aminoglycoside 6'-N-acetyltransferase I
MLMITIRAMQSFDLPSLSVMRNELWPDGGVDEHATELAAIVAGEWSRTYPYVIFVAEDEARTLVGFAEATLRSRADGCDPAHPVGFLEGWYVVEARRRARVGAELLRAVEEWALALGCSEIASDTWIDAAVSQRAHEALGFEVVDRCVHYRKRL